MGKLSIWLSHEREKSVRKLGEKMGLSLSLVVSTALDKYLNHMSHSDKKALRQLGQRALAEIELKQLREDGKLVQRELVHSSTNINAALSQVEKSTKSRREKSELKRIILRHAFKRKQLTKRILGEDD